jgi:hypothetical protein
MSVALRTALLQALSLPTDEKDPDEDTYERAAPQTAAALRSAPAASTASKTAAKKPKSEADIARDDLLAKVKALKLEPKDVAQLYLAENAMALSAENDADKIASFTERLQP